MRRTLNVHCRHHFVLNLHIVQNRCTLRIMALTSCRFPAWHTTPLASIFSFRKASTAEVTFSSFLELTMTFAPSKPSCLAAANPILLMREKGRDLTQSYYKNPYNNRNVQKGKVTTQTTPQKSSITQRLQTDLGRSVGVTTATQLVWLTWFTGPTFRLPTTAV